MGRGAIILQHTSGILRYLRRIAQCLNLETKLLQESYFTYSEEESPVDHDVHFRPGIGADGTETFTPRTVIYDLKGGFGTLKQYNALYEAEEPQSSLPRGLWYARRLSMVCKDAGFLTPACF